ncbi:hypothetical protein SAMN05421796_10925 [Chryseobacterium piscicola]|jgi:hypothetical protein|uniref:Uncharacterized protein n=1 Tax=Chryseobacterium piscicola TaxID=551459 RepID=A0A1N7NRU1_9FLAO|nr:hypothetical protein [Chryseobacterium piscicola]SIT01095.1 hypothetical protein SAMN05421796_10925 [Chryseobacterium piscicola]
MGFILSLVFVLLVLSLFLSKIKSGKADKLAKLFRVLSLVFSISIFTYWFVKKSTIGIIKDSVSFQLINKTPQTLDFYLVKINKNNSAPNLETIHVGKIRPEYYRVEHLGMKNSDEYWVAGYLGKKNMVYFSQHSVPNKNIDQIVEIQNYINQSEKLSERAKKNIEAYSYETRFSAIWVTLNLLLIFLNLILILRKKN